MKNVYARGMCYIYILVVLAACSGGPYAVTNKQYKKQARAFGKVIAAYPLRDSLTPADSFTGTTNFNLRKPNYVIIHHTAQNSCEQTLKTFTLPRTQVSAHYVICKDGTIHHMLNDYLRAWHGGIARWGNTTDINSVSVGIELDNNGFEAFTELQLNSLLLVLQTLKKNYAIPAANFIGHGDIAPTRKNDPNVLFPWKKLSEQGYGLWYDDTTNILVPTYFSRVQALRIIGYDIKDSSAALQAFKRHFEQDTLKLWNEADDKVLYRLAQKFL